VTDRPKLRRLTEAHGEDPLDSTWEVILPWDVIGCVSAPRDGTADKPREWACWSYRPDPDDPVDALADDAELADLGTSPAEMDDPEMAARIRAGRARFLFGGFTTRRAAVTYLVAHELGIT
jgi:hypothetical protein